MATKRAKAVKVSVGTFGGELTSVVVGASETVGDAFDKAGISVEDDTEILTLNGKKVSADGKVKSNETYYLSAKYKSQ